MTAVTSAVGRGDIDDIADRLCVPSSLNGLWRRESLPSTEILQELMRRLKGVIFPGYFSSHYIGPESLRYHMTADLDTVRRMLASQTVSGLCFDCRTSVDPCPNCRTKGEDAANAFMARLPDIRDLLAGDVQAAYEGDPAASSPGETIFCYPSIKAMFHHRIAHELFRLGVPVIPRIIAEIAHSETGIDIHPGASIGEDFFIDHGTGVVIGETCVIGRGCRLYQGVTLGALSFPKNEDGSLVKGINRHPVLEDNVTVYAGATILGRITVGANAIIGGNVWVTEDVPPGARITQERHG